MAEPVVSRAQNSVPWGPREWFLVGLVSALLGAFIGALIGGENDAAAVAVLGTIPGTVMLSIGVIAKAVQVGIRSARD